MTGLVLTWLGHSTVVLDVDRTRLVADPLLSLHPFPLRRRGSRPDSAAWRSADAVLLSHLHHDHAHLPSLRALSPAPVVTGRDDAEWVAAHGLEAVGLDVGERYAVGPVCVVLGPADHHSRPMPHRPNGAYGHLVVAGGSATWVAGDTALFDGLAALPGLAGAPVDVAVVPVSGWGPKLSGGHMGPVEAARACAVVGARWAVPVHWGTLHAPGGRHLPRGWMDRAGPAFAAALATEAPGCEAVVLAPGGSWTRPGSGPGGGAAHGSGAS